MRPPFKDIHVEAPPASLDFRRQMCLSDASGSTSTSLARRAHHNSKPRDSGCYSESTHADTVMGRCPMVRPIVFPDNLREPTMRLTTCRRQSKRLRRGATYFDTIRIRKDGTPFAASVTITPILSAEGVVVGAATIVRNISPRKQSELELSEAQSQFEAVVENLDDGLLIYDMEGKFLRSNLAARKILALSESNAMPADLDESFASYEMSTLMGTVLTKDERPVARLIHGEQLRDFEARARRLDSPWQRIISYSGTTVHDARGKMSAFLTLKDITARKEAEETLRLSEQRLRDAQRIAKMGSWDFDTSTGALVGSEQLFEIFGISKGEVGAGVDSFLSRVHPSDHERVDAARRALIAGNAPLDIECRIVIPHGAVKWVHAIGELSRGAHGQQPQFSGTVIDITSRQQAAEGLLEANASLEKRVGERTRELAIARDLAESANRLKSAFLATMSHELRTPLNSILGFTGIVLRGMAGPLTAEQSKQLGMVRSSARHLLSLINDVLDISKIEAGQLEIHAKTIDVRTLVDKVIETIAPMADKKGLPLRVSAAEWGILVSDPRRVEQVLLNLLDNAVKFTEQGDIELAVTFSSDYQITGATAGQRCVRFRVTDTGAGIKDSDLSKLFKPFQQIDSGLTRHHEGSGLGLVICRRLAGLLGGEILVESRFGVGSTFLFTIPQRPSTG